MGLGYILPITQYSYINYSYRMQENDDRPHYVDKSFKVIFDQKSNDMQNETREQMLSNHFERNINVDLEEKVELTGKGKYVNVKV